MRTIADELAPSVTSWQQERDGLLDRISYLEDLRGRAVEFLTLVGLLDPITPFDVGEAVSILRETPEQSVARRWPAMLDSETLNQEEDQQ